MDSVSRFRFQLFYVSVSPRPQTIPDGAILNFVEKKSAELFTTRGAVWINWPPVSLTGINYSWANIDNGI